MPRDRKLSSLPGALLLLLLLPFSSALSAHSPQDLFAYPKYQVVLSTTSILNTTATTLRSSRDLSDPTLHLMRTPAGQAFLCSVPVPAPPIMKVVRSGDEEERRRERERGLERGLQLVEPMRGGCLYQRQGWFTYSFCYGNEIRQFHATGIPPTEDLKSEAYSLGLFPAPVGGSLAPKYGSGSGLIPREGLRVPASLGGGNAMGFGEGEGGRYLSQVWEGGTICDKTGMPRSTEVQFHCNTQSTDRIALIRETETCKYLLIVHTPRICSEPVFLEGHDRSDEPAEVIRCQPVVKTIREWVDAPEVEEKREVEDVVEEVEELERNEAAEETSEEQSAVELAEVKDEIAQTKDDEIAQTKDDKRKSALLDALESNLVLVYDLETGEIVSTSNAKDSLPLDSSPTPPTRGTPASLKSLEDLAKVMRESIADALRAHADRQYPLADPPGLAAFEGLQDLLASINRGIASESTEALEANGEGEERGGERVGRERDGESMGSEEHAMLARRFGMDYGDQREVEGGEERVEEKEHAEVRERVRDEL